MSQAAIAAFKEIEDLELIYDDGEPLDSNRHRIQMNLLIDVIREAMAERQKEDFFTGGNMFVYFSVEQAQIVATQPREKHPQFRGPDVFFVGGVDGRCDRKAWVVWEEQGRYPDLIIELLSHSTAKVDRTTKKTLYERTFRTPEYFLYDPDTQVLEGFRLLDGAYQPVKPDKHPGREGCLWSRQLGLWLGRWQGQRTGLDATWLRLYDSDGRLIPTPEEAERQRADAEHQRAEAERQRADAAEAELARLRARLSAS
jgi:Uma2 family endonuclease